VRKWILNETNKYIIVFVLFVLVVVFLLPRLTGSNNVFFGNNKKTISAVNSDNAFSTGSDVEKNLFPEIKLFLTQHSELGKPVALVNQPDWAQGKRQTVMLVGDETDDYLFYTQNDEVVTVYKLNTKTTHERTMIWNKCD
jgi:hypothetical protein